MSQTCFVTKSWPWNIFVYFQITHGVNFWKLFLLKNFPFQCYFESSQFSFQKLAECFKILLVFNFNGHETRQKVIRTSQEYYSRVSRPKVDLGTSWFTSKRRTSKVFNKFDTREGLMSHNWAFPETLCEMLSMPLSHAFLSSLSTVESKHASKTSFKVITIILWCIKMNFFSMFEKSIFDGKNFFVEISTSNRIWILRFSAKIEVTHHFVRRVWSLECPTCFWKCFHRV